MVTNQVFYLVLFTFVKSRSFSMLNPCEWNETESGENSDHFISVHSTL